MQAIVNSKVGISPVTIYHLRQSGATLQQIADIAGRTKERVRQILLANYGETKHKLLSTEQMSKLTGLTKNRIMDLYQVGIIIPIKEWNTNDHHYLLWPLPTVEQVRSYCKEHRLCRMCQRPITKFRRFYCSEQCLKESRKYKYRSFAAQQKQLQNIRRYREKRKRLAQLIMIRENQRQDLQPLTASR